MNDEILQNLNKVELECLCWIYQNKHILVFSCQLELEGK